MPTSSNSQDGDRLARWRRPARRAGLALIGLGLLWILAHEALDRAPVRARVREKALATMAARLPAATLGEDVSIDWLFRASVGPLSVPAKAPGAPPLLTVERVKVRIAVLPLFAGRVEPATVRLIGVRLAPGPGGKELLDLVARLRRPRPGAPAPAPEARRGADPVLVVRSLTVALDAKGRTLDLGPVDLRLERTREDGAETIDAELELQGGGHAQATIHRLTPPEGTAPAWTLRGHLSASVRDLPAMLRGRTVEASDGALTLEASAEGAAGGVRATLRGALSGLSLRGARLGPEPVGPLDASGEAVLEASLAERRVRLRSAVLRAAGPLTIEASGELVADGDLPLQLAVTVPPVGYGDLLAALPRALAPGPDAPRPAGAVGGSLSFSGPLRTPGAWVVKAEVDLDGLRAAARRGPPSPLVAPFTARPAGEDGPAILLGPASADFVPIAALPQHVVRAVTASEDAGFFAHRGFDFDELRNALVAGLRAGKLQRGGSTITQQLAKNLYLSRDRTLARKVREALITVALEGTVPKARLLEIYLNLIEWGPSLHGIGPAARHYLGKDARALTPREACFLATLIPSPIRSHGALAAGLPVERWSDRIDDLLRKLAVVGVIDEEALARELAAPLALASWVPKGAAPAEAPAEPPTGREDEPEAADTEPPEPSAPGSGGAPPEPRP